MKDRIKIIFSLALFALISLGASAQYNTNYSYGYDDDVYIDNNNDRFDNRGDRAYRGNNRNGERANNGRYNDRFDNGRNGNRNYRANNRRGRDYNGRRNVRGQRQRKATILNRAYARAYADGWLSRRERRELRALENRLGIWRMDRRGRRICR
jgi:hypothetical protein